MNAVCSGEGAVRVAAGCVDLALYYTAVKVNVDISFGCGVVGGVAVNTVYTVFYFTLPFIVPKPVPATNPVTLPPFTVMLTSPRR